MKQFAVVESDFWGYFPVHAEYELRDDVLEDFKFMVMSAVTDIAYSVSNRRVKRVSGVDVFYGLEVNEHFHSAQFTFRTAQRKRGNSGQFVAYCMCAVIECLTAKSTSTVTERDGLIDVQVALPLRQADSIIQFIRGIAYGNEASENEVSTTVDSL